MTNQAHRSKNTLQGHARVRQHIIIRKDSEPGLTFLQCDELPAIFVRQIHRPPDHNPSSGTGRYALKSIFLFNRTPVISNVLEPIVDLINGVRQLLSLLAIFPEELTHWSFDLDKHIIVWHLPDDEVANSVTKWNL